MRTERGAASVLAVAIITTLLTVLFALMPLCLAVTERNRLAGAADAAALAAADVAVGREPGTPCAAAERVAGANAARITACRADGVVVTVRVTSARGFGGLPFDLDATATAGPPGAR